MDENTNKDQEGQDQTQPEGQSSDLSEQKPQSEGAETPQTSSEGTPVSQIPIDIEAPRKDDEPKVVFYGKTAETPVESKNEGEDKTTEDAVNPKDLKEEASEASEASEANEANEANEASEASEANKANEANKASEAKEAVPAKDGKEPPKKKKKKFSLLGCLFGLLFLYVFSIAFGIFVLWMNRENTVFLGNFGLINDAQLKDFILTAIIWSFMPLLILFLILLIIGVFVMASAKKDQKERRVKGLKMILVNVVLLFITVPSYVYIYTLVQNFPVSTQRIKAEIVVFPEDTSVLKAPTEITLDIKNIRTVLNRSGLTATKVEWDYEGDGVFIEVSAQENKIIHLYTTPGRYQVKVRITAVDAKGQSGEQLYERLIVIKEGSFGIKPSSGPAPFTVTFDATLLTQGQNIKRYEWDFESDNENDEVTTKPIVSHTYDKIGNYTVTLRVVDVNDNIKPYQNSLDVTPGQSTAVESVIQVTPSERGIVPFRVQFSADQSYSPSGNIVLYAWNFGDGSQLREGKNVSHVFKKAGIYNVVLRVRDEVDEEMQSTIQIVVKGEQTAPEAKIRTLPKMIEKSKTLMGDIPFVVTFDASDSKDQDKNIVDYAWDFDSDGKEDAFGSKTSYTFSKAGNFDVTLRVTDADGQSSTDTVTVQVAQKQTRAVISVDRESGPVPLTIQFDASQSSTSDGEKIVNFEWDFGDGLAKVPTGANVSHRYGKIGTYTVTLTVFAASGENAEVKKDIYVRVVPLQACFEPSRIQGKLPLTVTFDASCSTGTVQEWKWNYADGSMSQNRRPTHTFKKAGEYSVILEVTDNTNTVSKYSAIITVQK